MDRKRTLLPCDESAKRPKEEKEEDWDLSSESDNEAAKNDEIADVPLPPPFFSSMRPVGLPPVGDTAPSMTSTSLTASASSVPRPPPRPPRKSPTHPPTTVITQPPPAASSSSAQPWKLPRSLQSLGNREAWDGIAAHIRSNPRKVMVVHGATGCGKTEGVRVLARSLGMRVLELDGSDPESPRELVKWVSDTRRATTMRGPTMVLLDDFESFSAPTRKEVAAFLKSQDAGTDAGSRGAVLCPIIITCTQWRHPDMRDLSSFAAQRLRAPTMQQIQAWFRASAVSVQRADGRIEHVLASADWLARQSDLCALGDLRRVANAIRWAHGSGLTRERSDDAEARRSGARPSNIFEATRRLLLNRRGAADAWAAMAEERDMDLLREHLPHHTDRLERLARGLDDLSRAHAHAPERFELRESAAPSRLLTAAMAAQLTSRSRDVGALAPPPRLDPASGRPPSGTNPGGRPMTSSDWRDVPALLRDRV